MSHRADQHAVLDYRAAAHALDYAAGFFNKPLVAHLDYHVALTAFCIDLRYLDIIILRSVCVDGRDNLRLAGFDLVGYRHGHLSGFRQFAKRAVNADTAVFIELAYLSRCEHTAQLAGRTVLALIAAFYRGIDRVAAGYRQLFARVNIADRMTEPRKNSVFAGP